MYSRFYTESLEIKVIYLSLDNIKHVSLQKLLIKSEAVPTFWEAGFLLKRNAPKSKIPKWLPLYLISLPHCISTFMNYCFCLLSVKGSLRHFYNLEKRSLYCTYSSKQPSLPDWFYSLSLQEVLSLKFSLTESKSMIHFKEK